MLDSVRRRTLARRVERLSVWILSVALILLTSPFGTRLTPRGVQCPTAPVQQVVEVVQTRDAHGHLVGMTIVRKPQEGEAGFKQCRCAEKKSAPRDTQANSAESKFVPILAFAELVRIDPPVATPEVGSKRPTFVIAEPDAPHSPPTPPPQRI